MPPLIHNVGPEALGRYAAIPIAFEVRGVLDVVADPAAAGSWTLVERAVAVPYAKDYDAIPGERPTDWPARFDLSRWQLFLAMDGEAAVGGAALTWEPALADALGAGRGAAVLWDLRVAPDARGRGVGAALFRAAESGAEEHGCTALAVETQNVNVAACRFYAAMGCRLPRVRHAAYPTLPDEVQLVWEREFERFPQT